MLYITAEKSLKASPTAFQKHKVVSTVIFKPCFCSSACHVVPYQLWASPVRQRGLPGPAGCRGCLRSRHSLPAPLPAPTPCPRPRVSLPQPLRLSRRVRTCWDLPSATSPAQRASSALNAALVNQRSLRVVNPSLARVGHRSAGVQAFCHSPWVIVCPKSRERGGRGMERGHA